YFSVCFPYTQKDLNAFLSNVRNKRLIKSDTLCFSRAGRAVEELSIKPSEEVKYKVLITARHHAGETAANFVMEGIISSILNEADLQYLRKYVEFSFIPFVDKDGVEDGDQGKGRNPHDHNRDYRKSPIYPS